MDINPHVMTRGYHLSGYYKRCQPTCNNQLVIISGYQPTFHDQWKSACILWQEDINNSLVITGGYQPIGHDKWILAFLTNGLTSSYHDMRVDIFLSWHDGWYSLSLSYHLFFKIELWLLSWPQTRRRFFCRNWLVERFCLWHWRQKDLRSPPLISLSHPYALSPELETQEVFMGQIHGFICWFQRICQCRNLKSNMLVSSKLCTFQKHWIQRGNGVSQNPAQE